MSFNQRGLDSPAENQQLLVQDSSVEETIGKMPTDCSGPEGTLIASTQGGEGHTQLFHRSVPDISLHTRTQFYMLQGHKVTP